MCGGGKKAGRPAFAAVILAAGFSSRMKAFKPLMQTGGITALERLVGSVRQAGIDDIVVVTGYNRELLLPALERAGAVEANNPGYASGMFSSIKAGIERASSLYGDASGFFLMPVDCPLIDSDTVKKLEERIADGESRESSCNFYVPVFEGKKGHPLYIPACYAREICTYEGEGGLKAITDRYWDRMVRVPVDAEGCLLDMDTPEGYEEILAFLEAGCRREPLESLAAGRRIFLVRHGQTRQHAEKMFIGQYDVPLSDEGRRQMEATAKEMSALKPYVKTIYSSDLDRSAESAEILNGVIYESCAKVMEKRGLREISLGLWDGVPVRMVKEGYPEQYERRGRDMFAFKTGNRAENFYDMQYRAVKTLRGILESDESEDIVIVAHSGVIRALENNLKGLRVDDPWETLPKGGFRVVKV